MQTVAIKVLKESATKEAEEDFMREVEIMSTFRHENILTLIGVVPRGEQLILCVIDFYLSTNVITFLYVFDRTI